MRLEERLGFYQSPILIDDNLNKLLWEGIKETQFQSLAITF